MLTQHVEVCGRVLLFVVLYVCGVSAWQLTITNNVQPCPGYNYAGTISLFTANVGQVVLNTGASRTFDDAQNQLFHPYVGLGIQENGWYCRVGGILAGQTDCWNPDNSGEQLWRDADNCAAFHNTTAVYCGTNPPNTWEIVAVAYSGSWPNCNFVFTRKANTPCAPVDSNGKSYCPSGVTTAPTTAPTKAATASPTKAPTAGPTTAPTKAPTAGPATPAPTATKAPTAGPTTAPTKAPTVGPATNPPTVPAVITTGNFRLITKAGKYITLDANKNLVATGTSILQAAILTVLPVTTGSGSNLKIGGNFISAENGGTSPLIANRASASGWEAFTLSASGSYYSVVAQANGNRVSVQTANTLIPTVTTTTSPIPDSALFTFSIPPAALSGLTNVKVFSVSANAYVIISGNALVATAAVGTATVFTLGTLNNGYTFKANNLFTTADNLNGAALATNRQTASDWETFIITSISGNTYAITAVASNSFVQVTGTQLFATQALSASPTTAAQFTITAA